MNNENITNEPVNNILPGKRVSSLGMMTANFVGGFIIYQLIVGIIVGALDGAILKSIVNANMSDTVTNIMLVAATTIAVIVMDVIAVLLAVWSTFRKCSISKEIIGKALRNIIIFFGIMVIISGLGGYYSDDPDLISGLANFFGSVISLAGMIWYVKKKLNNSSI